MKRDEGAVGGSRLAHSPSSSESLAVTSSPPPIPDHELLHCIGHGSYGEVWLARNILGEFRAVKVIYRRGFEHERPFEREFEGIQKFEPISRAHPSQLNILHVGRNEAAQCFYYVMELADDAHGVPASADCAAQSPNAAEASHALPPEGGTPYIPRTLKLDLHRHGRLPVAECVRIGLALTTALEHLHRRGLVHRDIKPSNIIFVNGSPKLADIGLVASMDATMSFVGTSGFLPPEGPGTPQGDLYGLGKVLYEMSMGRDRQDFPQLPPDLLHHVEYPALLELNEVILKACEIDARQRYQSAAAMHADLALIQGGLSVKRLRGIERRLLIVKKAGLVAAILLAVTLAGLLYQHLQTQRVFREKKIAEAERRATQQLLYAADTSLAHQALESGNLARATRLLEGHRPVQGQEDLRGFEWHYLRNLCRGDEAHTFKGHGKIVEAVAMSPDGALLASGGHDQTIKLWDMGSKANLATLRGHTGTVNSVAFSPDGTRLASGSTDKTVRIWNLATRAVVAEFTNHAAGVTAVAFAPDGRTLAVGTSGNTATLWDLDSGRALHVFQVPDSAADWVAISPDGRWLAIGGSGSVVRLWELSTLRPVADLYEESGRVNGIAFSPDSRILATARDDGIYLWDIAGHRVIDKLRGHEAEVHPVAFSPDGKTLASGSLDSTVRVWDLASRQVARVFRGHDAWVRCLAFSADGQTLVSGSIDHHVKLWELSPKAEIGVLRGHTDSVQSVAFSHDDSVVATASLDGTVKLWHVASGTNISTLTGHTAGVTGVTFLRDGATLISCGLDKTIRFWNTTTGKQLTAFPTEKRLSCLALSPDGQMLAVGSGWLDEATSPNKVSFWDPVLRQPLTNHANVSDFVRALSFSPDGGTLAVGIRGGILELIDVASKTSFLATNLVDNVAWSPADGALAVSGKTEWISLFDIATRRISRRLQMPGAGARYAACSPDGKTMAVFYTTTRIKLCNLATGREVATLHGHEAWGMHLAFSHDGQTLATASHDSTARLWRAPRE